MRLSKIIFSLFFLLLNSATSFADDAMSMRAPDIAENGAVVPVTVNLASPMQPGETLKIFSNGNLAASIYLDGLSITNFSTRVRMMESGVITAELTNQQGEITFTERHVQVNIAAVIPDSASNVVSIRQRVRDNSVKVLFSNRMAGIGHIQEINFLSSIGRITVRTTPYMSQNPYIGILATENLGSVNITTDDRR